MESTVSIRAVAPFFPAYRHKNTSKPANYRKLMMTKRSTTTTTTKKGDTGQNPESIESTENQKAGA